MVDDTKKDAGDGAMQTKSMSGFQGNITRAYYFGGIHKHLDRGPAGSSENDKVLNELRLAGVVYAISALDAYLCEASAEGLLAQMRSAPANKSQRDALARVEKEVPGLSLEVAVLPEHEDRIKRIHDAVVDYFHTQTSRLGSKAVSKTIVLLGGEPSIVWSRMPQDPRPQPELDRLTEVRHQVVHKGMTPQVTAPEANACFKFCMSLAKKIDIFIIKHVFSATPPKDEFPW